MCTINGKMVYEDVITEFPCGSIYYIDKPYTGTKELKDIEGFNTQYLLGRRFELIISNDEFNKNSSFRWCIPIQTMHRSSDANKGILFRDRDGEIRILRIDQMRCRHVSDLLATNGAYFCYKFDNDFIDHVSNTLASSLPSTSPYMLEMKTYNTKVILGKIAELESRISELEKSKTVQNATIEKSHKSKYRRWDDKTKQQFLIDYNKSVESCALKYGISKTSAYKYHSDFTKLA